MDTAQFNPAKNPLFDIEEEGSVVNAAPIRKIDFTGTGVTVTEPAPGEIAVAVTGGLIQTVVQQYNPAAGQALTTAYADVDGSSYTFTPISAASQIVYQYLNIVQSFGGANYPISHWKLMVDGVLETEMNFSCATANDMVLNITGTIASWGVSAKIIKLQAREYTAAFPVQLFATYYMDGVGGTVLVRPTLFIQEFA